MRLLRRKAIKDSIDGQLIDRARIDELKTSLTATINNQVRPSLQIKGLRHMSKDPQEQNELAVELVEWTCSPEAFYIEKFPVSKGISPYRFFKVKHTNDFFAECVELANAVCHLNLKQAVHTGELHYSYVLDMLPIHDGDYKAFMIEKLAKKLQSYFDKKVEIYIPWADEIYKQEYRKEYKEELRKEISNEQDNSEQLPTQTIPTSLP